MSTNEIGAAPFAEAAPIHKTTEVVFLVYFHSGKALMPSLVFDVVKTLFWES